jgi:putative transposase
MNSDAEEHQRHSIRLKGYDYASAGGYYLTVVAFQRECLFGDIIAGEMQLNSLGKIVREEWLRSTVIRKEIRLEEDEFVVMPNHIHGILWIYDVGADGVRPIYPKEFRPSKSASIGLLQRPPKSLSSFIAGF